MPGTAILYLTHFVNQPILGWFLELRSDCERRGYDVVLLHDESRDPAPELPGARVYPFNLGSIRELGLPMTPLSGKPPAIVPGHTDYPLIHFYRSHPTYDHYWVVEYDVRYSGAWGDFFDTCGTSVADLLATHILRYRDRPSWCWWDSLRYKEQAIGKEEAISAFLPIYRLTGFACRLLAYEYRRGWAGHHETRLPTVLGKSGCRLEDLGGEGEFVPAGNENRFYLGENTRPSLEATFRWRPVMTVPGPLPGKLWHPVKTWSAITPAQRRRNSTIIRRVTGRSDGSRETSLGTGGRDAHHDL